MTDNGSPWHGWAKVTLLWMGTLMDNIFTVQTLQVLATIVVIVLTCLQIMVTWRRLKQPILPAEHTDTL